eukprot:CAMPEP_0196592038 /NCGR_PEP_ID=MMETSP1081-20130531/71676_1 /TAXON_ID=36882 /ORGANISM="Pyramimonas amylifera, Strain CCMP720" /LENGTH=184 /DNA_ID=CAMNT_0041915605 /DNA_START=94 /DNA_END=648 /DNA_ORIENTATION=+
MKTMELFKSADHLLSLKVYNKSKRATRRCLKAATCQKKVSDSKITVSSRRELGKSLISITGLVFASTPIAYAEELAAEAPVPVVPKSVLEVAEDLIRQNVEVQKELIYGNPEKFPEEIKQEQYELDQKNKSLFNYELYQVLKFARFGIFVAFIASTVNLIRFKIQEQKYLAESEKKNEKDENKE